MGIDKNYNQAIIRKLAKRDRKNNQIRNFFICITITCAAFLIFTFLLYLLGMQEEKLRTLKNQSQVSYENITMDQAKQCTLDKRIHWIGQEVFVGRKKIGETRLTISWQDKAFMELEKINYIGVLPIKSNEIMIPQQYLEILGKSQTRLGDIISLNLGDNVTRDYKISAILTDHSKAEKSQHIYVSLPCAMMLKGILEEENIRINISVNMKNAIKLKKKEAKKQAENIAELASISKEQILFNESYYIHSDLARLTMEDIITLILVTLLILTASYFVIHSIFYISIAAKIREYGQMRTIGMTKKQIKSLILQEGFHLLFKGSIPGLFLGGWIGYALVPNGFDIFNTSRAAVLCILLLILFVGISVRTPGKIAAEASPIEASTYTGYTQKNRKHKKHQNNKRELTPKYLANLNLKRNQKKTIFTMCSLILAGTLVGTIASYVISYDPAASVAYSFPEGNYQLTLNASLGFGGDLSPNGQMKLYSLLQAEGIMGKELLSELKSLNYVTNVKPWRYLSVSTTLFKKENTQIGLNGISKNDFELLKEMSYEGPDSYQEFSKQPGLIVVNEYYNNLQKNPLKIGDYVPINFYDGKGQYKEVSLPVLAIAKTNSWMQKNRPAKLPLSLMGSSFIMLDYVMDQWAGMNTTYGYEISVEQKNEKAAGIILEEMYGMEEDLYLDSKAEHKEYYEKQFFSTKLICYTLAVFLIIFGIINLVNTIITNLYSRRKELGILQAVGMTKEQLKDMLYKENLYYTGISSICTLLFGSLLGYAFVMTEIQMGVDMTYSYPWIPILLYLLIMFIMQKSLTNYGVKLLQKQSLTDRMKMEEF